MRYFLTAAREESITRAAEVLHVTQPTLSRQIAQMEQELGVTLFDRSSRRFALTNEGLLLRRRAEEILELVDKTEKELSEQDKALTGTVAVGCGDLAAVELLPGLFQAFHDRYPAITFDLYTASADYIRDRLDRGLTDIGLLLEPVSMEKYSFVRLSRREEWVVVMHPDCPLAALDRITSSDLIGVPLILPRRQDVQSELAHWFGDLYPTLNVLFTSNLPSLSSVMAHNRLACSVTLAGSVSFWDPHKITTRPLSPPLLATSVLAWRRQQPYGLAAEKFIQFIRRTLQPDLPQDNML